MKILKFNKNNDVIGLEHNIMMLCQEFNSGMMDEYELSYLSACIKNFDWKNDTYILEIGTYIGKTSAFMARVLKTLNLIVTIVGIDPFEFANDEPLNEKGSYAQYIETITRNDVKDMCFPVVTSSKQGFKIFKEKVGILIIDGCHTYECAKNDLELFSRLVVPNGYIFIDDYADNYPGVKRALDEWIKRAREFDIVHKENWFAVVKKIR